MAVLATALVFFLVSQTLPTTKGTVPHNVTDQGGIRQLTTPQGIKQSREKQSVTYSDELASLRSLVQQQAHAIQDLRTQVVTMRTSAALEKAAQESLAQMLQSVRAEVASHAVTLLEIGDRQNTTSFLSSSTERQPVLFNAQFTQGKSLDVGPDGFVVRFDEVSINTGGGYNSSTGAFTAPVSGTYLFFVRLKADGNHRGGADWVLEKSGTFLTHAFMHSDDNAWEKTSTFAATHMDKGESVVVKLTFGVSFLDRWFDTGFMGFLIAAD